MSVRTRLVFFGVMLATSSHVLQAASLSAGQLQNAITEDLTKVSEFRAIKEEATKRGLRVWLFGGTAASFGHYAKWDKERKAGDTKYQPERFDYDYTNIYRSTQDMDLAVDGTPEQSDSFKAWLTKEYPYFEGDKGAGWDVRSLKHKTPRMDALLEDIDFSNQHTDSNSTGMIEITDPPAGEVRIRDVRAWDSKTPPFFEDVLNGHLHFYYSPEHKTTRLYKEGSNPEITSVIRYLTKAFQYDLKIPASEEAKIKPIVDTFNASDVGAKPEYSNWKNWIEKHGKKLMRHAVDMEHAQNELDRLGLRQKLIQIRNDAGTLDSLAWWLNKEPLKSKPLGQGNGKTAREVAAALGVKPDQPIIVTHETNSLLAHESITKSHRGELNAFISRVDAPGESAALGPGFYTRLGEEGARGTKLPIKMTLNPNAREGSDFTLDPNSRYFVITNKNAVTVIPESLNIGPVEYFRMLEANSDILIKNKAVAERLKRRVSTKLSHLSDIEKNEINRIVSQAIAGFDGLNFLPLIDASYDSVIAHNPKLSAAYETTLNILIEKGNQNVLIKLAQYTFSKPFTKDMQGAIEKLIEKDDWNVLIKLAQYTFSQPHTKDMQRLIEKLIEKGDWSVLGHLAQNTFSQPHTKDMQGAIEKLIEKGGWHLLTDLARYTFPQPHTKDMQGAIEKLIKKGDQEVLSHLADYTFPQPHTKDMQGAIEKLIEKGDQDVLSRLAHYTFSQPHTKDMQGPIEKLIEKGDQNVLINLAQHTFSKPHTKDMRELIAKLIEKDDEAILICLARDTFSQPHTQGPDYKHLKDYLEVAQKSWNLYPNGGTDFIARSILLQNFRSGLKPNRKNPAEDTCIQAITGALNI